MMNTASMFDYILLCFFSFYIFKWFLAAFDCYMGKDQSDLFSEEFEERLRVYQGLLGELKRKIKDTPPGYIPKSQRLEAPFDFNLPDHLILGVKANSSTHEFKVAYHKLAKIYHPDHYLRGAQLKTQEIEFLHKRFLRIKQAYENLCSSHHSKS